MSDEWECSVCNGTGRAQPDCPQCYGDGWVEDKSDGGTMTCPSCNYEPCSECDGTDSK